MITDRHLPLLSFCLLSLLGFSAGVVAQSGVVFSPGLEAEEWRTSAVLDIGSLGYLGGDPPEPVVTADTDGDGSPDVVTAELQAWGSGGEISARSGRTGSLIWSTTYQGGYYTAIAAHEDLDNDGREDLLLATHDEVHFRSGLDGSHFDMIPAPVSGWESGVISLSGTGDVTGDGIGEVLLGFPNAHPNLNWRAGSVFLFSGAAPGGAPLWQVHGQAQEEQLGYAMTGTDDLNGDGFPDMLIGATGSSELRAVSGVDGTTLWSHFGPPSTDTGAWIDTTDDLNGDGVPEVLSTDVILDGSNGAVLRPLPTIDYWRAIGDQDDDGVRDLFGGTDGPLASGTYFESAAYSGATGELLFGVTLANIFASEAWFLPADDLDGDGRHEFFGLVMDSDPDLVINRIEFQPVMSTSTDTISLSSGGVLTIALDFTAAARFQEYRIITGSSGVGYLPVSLTVVLPLAYDQTVFDTFNGAYPSFASGMSGMLDANGTGGGNLAFPPGLPGSLLGRTYTVAALAGYPWGWWTRSSVAASYTFVP